MIGFLFQQTSFIYENNENMNLKIQVLSTFKKIIIICIVVHILIACSKNSKDHIPQKGEIVTWNITQGSELIIHTQLEERFIYSDEFKKSIYYKPEYENYLGQFPIDFEPPLAKKITKEQALNTSVRKGSLTFNLMLNGSNSQAKGYSNFWTSDLDHPDQVRVELKNRGLNFDFLETTTTIFQQYGTNTSLYDEQISKTYGLECYKDSGLKNTICFGKSDNKKISGIIFKLYDNKVIASSTEPMYGAINLNWQLDLKNLKYWKEIDRNIWRLLDAWNIAPDELNDNKRYQDKHKSGDLVVWRVIPSLLFKTYVGERIKTVYKYPAESYFLGQFPIDYRPQKQKLLSTDQIENASDFQHSLQFNLLLKGVKNIPINDYHHKVFPNQVKVIISNMDGVEPIAKTLKRTSPREWIDYLISLGYEKNDSLSLKYDLECYSRNLPVHLIPSDQCIAKSSIKDQQLEFLLKRHKNLYNQVIIEADIETALYPSTKVSWVATEDHMKDWKIIDENIWRILEIWDVTSR